MKHLLSIVAFFFLAHVAFAQTSIDTVYFDSNWKKAGKNDYEYIRVMSRGSSDLYAFKDYWKSGQIYKSGSLSASSPQTREGAFKFYHKNGNVSAIENFKNDHVIGHIQVFDSTGKFDYEYISELDSLDNASQMKVSLSHLRNHIAKEVKYPEKANRMGIEGKVMVRFSVDASGKVTRLTLTKRVYKELDNEAIRVIESFKKWPVPTYKGKNTNLVIVTPIDFRLADE